MNTDVWHAQVKRILKAEPKGRKVGYFYLVGKLAEIGFEENEKNIAKKSRAKVLRPFFLPVP